jgi:anti-sigma-K factor RskA
MADRHLHDHEGLSALALLYASGELDAIEAAEFECRLANDQEARDALVEAVALNQTLCGLAALRPAVEYRQRVAHRLLGARVEPSRHRSGYPGHPLLWAVAGAAAAVLGMLALPGTLPRREAPVATPAPNQGQSPPKTDVMPLAEMVEEEADEETIVVWSEVPRGEHLTRAIGDGNRRRSRLEDRRPSRSEERLTRFLEPSRTMN